MCDLDRHSVKAPGVDATYHVLMRYYFETLPTFLLSMAESNLILRSCREAMTTTSPCYAVNSPCSRLCVVKWRSTFPHGLADQFDHLKADCTALAQSPAAVSDLTNSYQHRSSFSLNPDNVLEPVAFHHLASQASSVWKIP